MFFLVRRVAVACGVISCLVLISNKAVGQDMDGAVDQIGEYSLLKGKVDWLDCSADQSQLLVGSSINYFDLVDVRTMKLVKNFRTLASHASFTCNASRLVVTNFILSVQLENDYSIKVIDADTEKVITTIPAFPMYRLDSKRELLAFANPPKNSDTVCIYDLKKDAIIQRWKVTGTPIAAVCGFSKSGIVGINPMDIRTALLWFPPYDQAPMRLQTNNEVHVIDVSPDGRVAAFGTYDNQVELWDTTKKSLIRKLKKHDGEDKADVRGLLYSSDGAFLVSLSQFGEVIVWETQRFKEIARFQAHECFTLRLIFFPDGKTFATGGDDGVKLWRIQTEL